MVKCPVLEPFSLRLFDTEVRSPVAALPRAPLFVCTLRPADARRRHEAGAGGVADGVSKPATGIVRVSCVLPGGGGGSGW